jgi:propionaldehyde dehydrogenase
VAINEQRIAQIVEAVIKNIKEVGALSNAVSNGDLGLFDKVDDAINAAYKGQKQLMTMGLEKREELIAAVRAASIQNAESLARLGVEESGLGRVEHKIIKNINAAKLTPGTEDLVTQVKTGETGIGIREGVPFGVICSILPTTHPASCVINHVILGLASGNAMFFCPHPRGQRTGRETIRILNKAIIDAGGPENLFVAVKEATLEVVQEASEHPLVSLIMATGGPAVVAAALRSGKKAMGAGPGNPPVIVDETCDVRKAAKDVVEGHVFDNNILCIAEKEVFVVESVADEFENELEKLGGYQLKGKEIDIVTDTVIKDLHAVGEFVGKDCDLILKKCGINTGKSHEFAWMEVDEDHPMVMTEQMMPILPVVRVRNFDEALQCAIKAECGYRHTAMIHSRCIERISRFSQELATTITVANAPSGAGLGIGSMGVFGHTLAEPTGEGVVTPRTLQRERRFVGGALFKLI